MDIIQEHNKMTQLVLAPICQNAMDVTGILASTSK